MTSDRRRRLVTKDETRLWRQVMKDAVPLPGHALPDDVEEPPPPPELAPLPKPPEMPRPRDLVAPAPPASAPRLDHGKMVGLDKRTGERMKKGEMVIDGRIDLHGLIQDAAHGALRRFVLTSAEMGRRCLLVITGKGREGGGVLRREVPRWLNEPSLRGVVLAFSYAQPKHGGDGALYVLLKRRR